MNPPFALPPLAGVGLKPQHYAPALQSVSASKPDAIAAPGWLEIHPQNYFGAGGPPHRWLSAIAEKFALSFHSVGLSLGSAAGLVSEELEQLAGLCDRYNPAMVSEHLSWSGSANNRYPDLLPVAGAMAKKAPEAQIILFLMADSVLCANTAQKTLHGYDNIARMLKHSSLVADKSRCAGPAWMRAASPKATSWRVQGATRWTSLPRTGCKRIRFWCSNAG